MKHLPICVFLLVYPFQMFASDAGLDPNEKLEEFLKDFDSDLSDSEKETESETLLNILRLRPDINCVCEGLNALDCAVMLENLDLVHFILQQNSVLVDRESRYGMTPLFAAVNRGCLEISVALLRVGASPRAVSKRGAFGESAGQLAANNGHVFLSHLLLAYSGEWEFPSGENSYGNLVNRKVYFLEKTSPRNIFGQIVEKAFASGTLKQICYLLEAPYTRPLVAGRILNPLIPKITCFLQLSPPEKKSKKTKRTLMSYLIPQKKAVHDPYLPEDVLMHILRFMFVCELLTFGK